MESLTRCNDFDNYLPERPEGETDSSVKKHVEVTIFILYTICQQNKLHIMEVKLSAKF